MNLTSIGVVEITDDGMFIKLENLIFLVSKD